MAAIAVNIITTFDAGDIQKAQRELAKLAESIEKPGDKLKDLGSKFQATGKSISSVGVGISKSIGAVSAAFIAFGVSSVKAAAQAEAEQNRLRQILLATGLASEEQIKSLNAQSKALENLGVVSAGNVTITQSQLATFDLQAETIQRLTPAILDYVTAEKGATASAEEFKSMTNGLAQALQGNFASLTRTGFVLDETTKNLIKNGTEAERSAALVDVLNSTYKGFNETLRGTTEGRLQVIRNSFDDLRTRIGEGLLPVMETFLGLLQNKLMPFIDRLVTKFENLTDGQRKAVVGLTLFGAIIGPTIILVGSLTTAIGTLLTAMGLLQVAAAKVGIVLKRVFLVAGIVIALGVAIKKLADNFEPVSRAIGNLKALFTTGFASMELSTLRVTVGLLKARAAVDGLFSKGVSPELQARIDDLTRRAIILSGTIDQAFANVRNKSVLATEALRDQTTASRGLAATNKTTGLTAEELAAKLAAQTAASDKAKEAAKRLAEKLKEQAKAIKAVGVEFADFANKVNAPEATIEDLLAKANTNLAKFRATAADTSIPTDRLINRLENLSDIIMDSLNSALQMAQAELKEAQARYDAFASSVSQSIRGIVNFGSAMQTAQSKSKAATEELTERIKVQSDRLKDAQKVAEDYAEGISRAVSSTLNFGKAFESATKDGTNFLDELRKQVSGAQTFAIQIRELVARGLSQEALAQVVGAGETGTAIARELLSGGASAIQEANDLVLSLQKAADEAGQFSARKFHQAGISSAQQILDGLTKEIAASTSFLDALNDQAQNATLFAEKVNQLIRMGLSESALTEVLAAGVDAGMLIADSIIDGGQSVVTQVNSLVSTVESVAAAVGILAADAYYQAGIDIAQNLVDGILDQINSAAAAIAAAIAAALAGREGLGNGIPAVPKVKKGGTAFEIGLPLEQLQAELQAQVAQNKNVKARLEAGGLGATPAARLREKLTIGRIGAESLRTDIRTFPDEQRTQSNVNVTVNAGLGTNGQDIGKEIVEAIIQFQRRSGEFLVENK